VGNAATKGKKKLDTTGWALGSPKQKGTSGKANKKVNTEEESIGKAKPGRVIEKSRYKRIRGALSQGMCLRKKGR